MFGYSYRIQEREWADVMSNIDQTSEAIGRIEAKCDTILTQNRELFTKINANDQRVSVIEGTVGRLENGNRLTHATWGAGAGGAIVGIAEILKSIFGTK